MLTDTGNAVMSLLAFATARTWTRPVTGERRSCSEAIRMGNLYGVHDKRLNRVKVFEEKTNQA